MGGSKLNWGRSKNKLGACKSKLGGGAKSKLGEKLKTYWTEKSINFSVKCNDT